MTSSGDMEWPDGVGLGPNVLPWASVSQLGPPGGRQTKHVVYSIHTLLSQIIDLVLHID